MKRIFKWAFKRLDVVEQITIKRALRKMVDDPLDKKEEGHELMKEYAKDLLKLLNKGELLKF